jgi:FKBP-type peptidyl-prolyl cis-trans isomerase FkpA
MLLPTIALVAGGCQQESAKAPPAEMTEDQKAIYSYGAAVGQQVEKQTRQLRLTPEETDAFRNGVLDTMGGKAPAVEIAQYEKRFQELAEARVKEGAEEAQKLGAEFLAAAGKEPNAVTTESGLVYQVLAPGQGERPKATDTVRVHYQGTLTDGKVFDSSRERGEPAEFALNRVIPCWTEGVQKMQVGERAKLVCPAAIAYGDRGAGGKIPPGATLVFEVELLGIKGK